MKAKASELFAGQTQDVPDVFVYYSTQMLIQTPSKQ